MNRKRPLRALALFVPLFVALLSGGLSLSSRLARQPSETAVIGKIADGVFFVPTGQTLTPEGQNLTFDSRPLDMALSPDGKTLAVLLPGAVKLLDTAQGRFRTDTLPGTHEFGGITWSSDGRTLYTTGKVRGGASGDEEGGAAAVLVTRFDADGHAASLQPIHFSYAARIKPNVHAQDAAPCGLALSPDDKTLYVSLFNNGTVAVVDLSAYNPETGAAPTVEAPVGSSPERLALSAAGDRLYVANRGGKVPESGDTVDKDDPVVVDPASYKASTGTVSVIDTTRIASDPAHAVINSIPVGLQPADMAFSPDGKTLYTANANGETVTAISTAEMRVVETIPVSPAPGRLAAASPNGLAVSKDGATLYVTLGGDNAVELLILDRPAGGQAAETRIDGLIPTAWFPLAVTLSADGHSLYVANSKGIGSLGAVVTRPRSLQGTMPEAGPGGVVQPANLTGHSVYSVMGSLSIVPVPNAQALARETAQVRTDNHFDRMAQALQRKPDAFWSRFKHVVLIIKENRTYDQVFGDIPVPPGHIGGDSQLVMFGEKVTPNHHALAGEYGLFDNLYCSGAISADGHHWLNEAFADDYDERAMNDYPRAYPCCGKDPLSFAGNKFLWQEATDAGLSFRNYGEFAPLPSIRRNSDNAYDTRFKVTANRNEDVAHCERIMADLGDSGKPLAQLTTIWFPNDHTSGTRPGSFTPESDVADNDLAVGRLVDTLSHSKRYWHDEPTIVFVVEDDAQGGLDHVEGHRTVGLVISPYNKRHQVFSTNYTQLNMVRTIEVILGLAPLNQFDAAALPMRGVFTDHLDDRPYTAHANEIALNLINPPLKRLGAVERHWAAVSAQLDFSAPDRADPEKLTEILWRHTHANADYPPIDAAR